LPVKEKLDDEIFCVDTLATPLNLLELGIKKWINSRLFKGQRNHIIPQIRLKNILCFRINF
jgi:hypothetical protein